MKMNGWLLLPLLVMLVAGCETNYHGPAHMNNSMGMPPSFWDHTANMSETGARVSSDFIEKSSDVTLNRQH